MMGLGKRIGSAAGALRRMWPERGPPPLDPARRLAPIALMSFNRPHYLEQVLRSLLAQRQDLRARRIYFYQDGAVSRLTGRVYAEERDIAACRKLFADLVPWGAERYAGENVGVARNFRRAEEELFGDPGNDVVYFFEDDMVLHPQYLNLLDGLETVTANLSRPVGYYAAYGELRMPVEKQFRGRHEMQRLDHHWGFALRREHWLKMQPLLSRYYAFVETVDYGDRNSVEILRMMHAEGAWANVSSQDDVKKAISYALGAVSLNTVPAAARYIGVQGLHMNQRLFEQAGYDRTVWLRQVAFRTRGPDAQLIERFVAEEMAWRKSAREQFELKYGQPAG